ncbi:hypothetical protein V1502_10525 [Bacillus sp. SCS-153A]|uniref:hypothetical protein n=1 Tax=Rossellomorea sedimentorum TaxID=3115294 RepID=UPI003905B09C
MAIYMGIGLFVVVSIGLFGALGKRTLQGSKEEQLQELERVKSQSGGFGGF